MKLIDAGLVQRVQIGASIASVYESLIDGSALRTLDDGEAATIAYAHQAAGVALIDERKARTLCAASFPGLVVASTVELLLHDAIALALGEQGQAEVLASALMKARMRVPPEHLERVRAIIGAERAAACSSLTRAVRKAIAEFYQVGCPKNDQALTRAASSWNAQDLLGSGAPRSMKMGTFFPRAHDAAVCRALQSINLRRPAILRYVSWASAGAWSSIASHA